MISMTFCMQMFYQTDISKEKISGQHIGAHGSS